MHQQHLPHAAGAWTDRIGGIQYLHVQVHGRAAQLDALHLQVAICRVARAAAHSRGRVVICSAQAPCHRCAVSTMVIVLGSPFLPAEGHSLIPSTVIGKCGHMHRYLPLELPLLRSTEDPGPQAMQPRS